MGRNIGIGAGALLALAVAASGAAASPDACESAVARAEAEHGIPAGLLTAIARVESGRPDGTGQARPWPWTINAEGRGRYLASKHEAMAEAGRLLGRRVGVVDVGCMGVNLYHHPDAFPTLADAFAPETNAAYAAGFLRSLYRRTGSWDDAVARYHNADPALGGAYRARVYAQWRGAGRGDAPTARVSTSGPLQRAAQAFAAGRFDSAAMLFADVLAREPDSHAALLGVAVVLEAQGHADEARMAYRRLLTIDRRNALALANLLDLVDRLPEDAALAEFEALRQLLPQSADVAARLAEFHMRHRRDAAALPMMAEAVRLGPGRPALVLGLAILFDRAGRSAEAIRNYERFFAAGTVDLPGVSLDGVRRRLNYLLKTAR